MKNSLLIEKILKSIDYKNHKLSRPLTIDDEIFTDIIVNENESDSYYKCVIVSANWELPLKDLTNRELIQLYQSR